MIAACLPFTSLSSNRAESAPKLRAPAIVANIDMALLGTVVLLLGIGLVMVSSSSISIAEKQMANPFHYLQRQLVFVIVGVIAGAITLNIPIKVWEKMGLMLVILAYTLLVLVLIPGIGKTVNGSTRWIPMGLINLQASEVVKLLMIIYMGGYLVRRGENVRESFRGFCVPMGLLAITAILLLLEPDFGATVVISTVCMGMLFLAGARLWQFAMLSGLAMIVMSILAVTSPYRMQRLTAFLNPWEDPFNSGFQLTQSLIAIGSGDWFGAGLGNSVQKLFYLPEAHTDFLFAVYAEEMGLVGVAFLIVLFGFVVLRAMRIGAVSEAEGRTAGGYLSYGIAIWIGMQAFINMGVNMGVLPTKGLTLPLMSYGGSSLIIMCAALGILLRVDYENRAANVSASRVPETAKKRSSKRAKKGANEESAEKAE